MATIALWCVALVLGLLVWHKKSGRAAVSSLGDGVRRAISILPRLIMIIAVAGFFFRLLPDGLVAQMLGPDTGIFGVLFAMLVGGLIPGGGSITFTVIVMLAESGAGIVQLMTLVTAWSVFALHRVVIYEVPLMGARFTIMRVIASLPLPLVAAGISALVVWAWG
jgi:hypothetical protein